MVTVAPNPRGISRSASIVVNDQRLSVAQEARACTFTLASSSAQVEPAQTTVDVTVETIDGCEWRASTATPWLRVDATARTGSGSVAISVEQNDGTAVRQGTVTVAGQPFTVTQTARTSPAPVPAPAQCTPSVQPAEQEVAAAAQSESVDLETGASCAWTATSHDAWITITSPARGTGSARIQFSITANTGSAARTGRLTVAGLPVAIRQLPPAAPPPCTYTLSPASRSVPAEGGRGSVTLSARADCAWSASEDADWITLATTSGNGDATVAYTVAANTQTTSRSASITIAGRTHRVTQAAAAPACSYTLDPAAQSVGAGGGEARFRVVTQSGCAWTAASNAAWTTTSSAGSGPGEVVLTVQPNTATATRAATITAGGQSHTLTQAAAAPACSYTLDPGAQSVGAGGGEARFRVVTQSGCAWTAASNAAWATTSSAGSGPGEVVLTVQPNTTTAARAAAITAGGQSHTLSQAAPPSEAPVRVEGR